jgi:succinyl-CoA synthetase beta subunit
MNIHEYQAKRILKEYGIKVPQGYLIEDPEDSARQARKIQTDTAAVKAQVHAGGRGKAGGVRIVETLTEAVAATEALIGKRLITRQTGEEGVLVQKVYIEESCSIKREYYLSLVLDRADSAVTVVASREGGMDIEEVAAKSPEKIINMEIDPVIGLADYQVRAVTHHLEIPEQAQGELLRTLKGLYQCYIEKDCNMIEINPLALTEENELIALDAKISFDDNALYRQPDILELRDIHEEDPKEVEASKFNLSYIALEGTIGCLVNGAGLAMATMDSIKYAGGVPANFLDVGGSASVESVTNAFRIILSDPKVKGIFVNIFGGIMRCDTIARGIIEAAGRLHPEVPIVVRLQGTNETKGKELLNKSGLRIYTADSLDEGAELVVRLAGEGGNKYEHMGQ